jgi:hypothetical protein
MGQIETDSNNQIITIRKFTFMIVIWLMVEVYQFGHINQLTTLGISDHIKPVPIEQHT